jgi:hypothetical protein
LRKTYIELRKTYIDPLQSHGWRGLAEIIKEAENNYQNYLAKSVRVKMILVVVFSAFLRP